MTHWWEVETTQHDGTPAPVRAVAYYRHSAQDRQENSIPIQQEQVRQFAQEHGIQIIEEFADAGISGLNAEDRPAFTQMMDEWVKQRDDFQYVLCLDVSRWGRSQDIDRSAQYAGTDARHLKALQAYDRRGRIRAPRRMCISGRSLCAKRITSSNRLSSSTYIFTFTISITPS